MSATKTVLLEFIGWQEICGGTVSVWNICEEFLGNKVGTTLCGPTLMLVGVRLPYIPVFSKEQMEVLFLHRPFRFLIVELK